MPRTVSTGDLWWKNAVIYCVDVETYYDSDGDGVGDLAGLIQRVDYLAELGVTCLWLMPFYPTPDRDDGYDVTDLFGVDSRLGTHGDLVELVRAASDRGIRVIADLVVNHTSAQHPWFKAARRSKDNRYRDYYVWRADPPPDTSDKVVFPDKEDSIWELDERTGEWYLHHFYSHQPDLNFANPAVREHIAKSIGFWLQLGLSGFRVDAVPFLIADVDTAGDDVPGDPHDYLKALRSFLGRRRGDAILLGEVNLPHKEQRAYFGGSDGDELTMMFDFIGMEAMYLALAREDARPLAKALRARPKIQLSDEERQQVFAAFGPDPDMQIYGRGLKRRLPTMMGGDPRRVRMVYSLLFSLPGTPTLYYGEEIGMGEDLEAEGRMAVRTPMQWEPIRNGGFSSAPSRRLIQRLVPDGYGPEHVNVADQKRDPDSLWNFMRALVQTYREILAHRCHWEGSSLVAVHNLSSRPVTTQLHLEPDDLVGEEPVWLEDLFAHEALETSPRGEVELALEGYGHRWLRVRRDDRPGP
jgi:glycosidase